jgi:hypothetical protein
MACRLFFGRAPMLRYSCGTSFTGGQQLHWLECQVPDASLLLQLKDSRSQLVPSPWTLRGCMVKLSLPSLGKIRIGGGSSRAPLTLPILDVRFENGIYCLIFSRTCHVSRDLNHSEVWEGKERKAHDSTGFFYQKTKKGPNILATACQGRAASLRLRPGARPQAGFPPSPPGKRKESSRVGLLVVWRFSERRL